MKTIEDLEKEINEERETLTELEEAYDAEEDTGKCIKLEYKIARKETIIEKLTERQESILEKENTKNKPTEKKDEDVCSSCGGDLEFAGTDRDTGNDIYRCENCGELYEEE